MSKGLSGDSVMVENCSEYMEDTDFLHTLPTLSSSKGKLKKPKEMMDHPYQLKKKKRWGYNLEHVVLDRNGQNISCKRAKTASNGLNNPGEVKPSTVIRAEEVQSSVGTEFPSFVKLIVKSHISTGFWMGLPMAFCKSHLPKSDVALILEDESGERYDVKFLVEKAGLSGGWKKFAVVHKLLAGDALVFQLVEAYKFKVYIIRANDLTDVDGALGLLNLDARSKQSDSEKNTERVTIALKKKKRKRPKSISIVYGPKEVKPVKIST